MGRERDREVVLTCLKQHQHQQQAGAHGQIAPVFLYPAGVRPPGWPAAPCRAAERSRGVGVLNNPPGPLLQGLYIYGSAPV